MTVTVVEQAGNDVTVVDGATRTVTIVDEQGAVSTVTVSIPGRPGTDGTDGADGRSAYQIALDNGFVGSEVEWLASLDGQDGQDGTNGTDGADGKSAYQLALDNGFVGTEADWLASLEGPAGSPGVIQSIVAGDNVLVDNTDPANPVISSTGGGSGGGTTSLSYGEVPMVLSASMFSGPVDTSHGTLSNFIDGIVTNSTSYIGIGTVDDTLTYLTCDLGQITTISKIRLIAYYFDNRYYNDLRIETSVDGVQWTTRLSAAKGKASIEGFIAWLEGGADVRYIRFGCTGNSVNGARPFVEFEVWQPSSYSASGNTPIDLDYLTDVDTSTTPPQDGQTMIYDAASGLWKPGGNVVTSWTALALQNSWVNYGAPYQICQYRLNGDKVELRGLMKGGAIGATAFVLPVGARPPANVQFATEAAGGHGSAEVQSNGIFKLNAGATTAVSINLSFSTKV